MGKVTRRTQKERDLAVEIVKNGGTFEEASSKTGYGVDYVRQLCTKAGVHKRKCIIDPEREQTAVKMIERGVLIDDIAEQLGYSAGGVRSLAKRHGYHVESKYKANLDARNKKIIALRMSGFSMNDIADRIGISFNVVFSVCKNHGLSKIELTKQKQVRRRCQYCGKEFTCHPNLDKRFCSEDCRSAFNHATHDIKRRQRVKKNTLENGITLKKVAERDHDICHICGRKVDWNDYKIVNGKKVALANYPSRDHLIPLCKGGTHSWDNIRLAHISCNSKKGVCVYG